MVTIKPSVMLLIYKLNWSLISITKVSVGCVEIGFMMFFMPNWKSSSALTYLTELSSDRSILTVRPSLTGSQVKSAIPALVTLQSSS